MEHREPSEKLLRLLKAFCRPAYYADIEGDLLELYYRRADSMGARKANLLLLIDILFLFRPGIVKPIFTTYHSNSNTMIIKDFKFAFRSLMKNRVIAAINILGLTVGISACLVIFLIAHHELTYDKFQQDGDRIFRVYSKYSGVGGRSNRGVPTAIANVIKSNFTGIEALSQFHVFGAKVDVPDAHGGMKQFDFYRKIAFVGPEYFELFNYYDWIAGSKEKALQDPHAVVLTASRAQTYFGALPPADYLGREVHYSDSLKVSVAGIVDDIRENTDFDFTDFISYQTTQNSWLKDRYEEDVWDGTTSSTQLFIKLSEGTAPEKIMEQMPRIASIYKERNKDAEWGNNPQLQPLAAMHFDSELGVFDGSRAIPEKSTLQILVVTAALLLLIAAINFVNLETAQASRRAKEVGVRKVLGSSRTNLVRHFLVQSFMLTLMSVVLSVGVAKLSLSVFGEFIPPDLTIDFSDPALLLFLSGFVIFVTLLAGIYPALIMSSYSPARALKNMFASAPAHTRSSVVRKGLTVFQFGVAYTLIIVTTAITMQLDYMLDKDLGTRRTGLYTSTHPGAHRKERSRFSEMRLIRSQRSNS